MANKDIIKYGRALYYPHIHFTDELWLKTAALYYEGIDRIVPNGFKTEDHYIVKKLQDEGGFIRNVDPSSDSDAIAVDFLEFSKRQMAKLSNREKLKKHFELEEHNGSTYSIHMKKVGNFLHDELEKIGLVAKSRNGSDWYDFDKLTGIMYMTCLANHIAENKNLPLVTDDPNFVSFLKGYQEYPVGNRRDIGEAVASVVIKSAVPENLEAISISKIMKFRKDYGDERLQFYNEINKLISDIKEVDDKCTLDDILHVRKKVIDAAVKNLKRSLIGIGISTATGLLGLSVPSFLKDSGVETAAVGVVAVATGKLLTQTNDYYKSKKGSPYSYVLTLRKNLKAKTFAEQLLSGRLIF